MGRFLTITRDLPEITSKNSFISECTGKTLECPHYSRGIKLDCRLSWIEQLQRSL